MKSPSPPGPLSSPAFGRPIPPGRERGKKAAAGYNLVMLMVLLAVLNIVIAASLPAWSGVIRQEKEEELVFRGLQYAEAIRVFQNRFQRPPIRLEELIEVEPRSIRQLWKDPMTENGKWALIPLQGPPTLEMQNPVESEDGRKGEVTDDKGGEDEGESEEEEGGFGVPGKGGEVQIGPLKGVHSKSRKTSFLIFNGKDRYDEWWFTVDLLVNPAAQTQGRNMTGPGGDPTNPVGTGLQMSTRWIGRPLPEFLQPSQPEASPGGFPVDGGMSGSGGKGGGRPRSGSGKPG